MLSQLSPQFHRVQGDPELGVDRGHVAAEEGPWTFSFG